MTIALPAWIDRLNRLDHTNPDFTLTREEIALEWERMRSTPKSPERPVLCLAGYHAWHFMVAGFNARLRGLVGGPKDLYLPVSYPFTGDIRLCAEKVAARVKERWGEGREIDVVAVSMGGLVARLGALPAKQGGLGRLNIARLYTMATPHNGAILANKVGGLRPDAAAQCMRPGSEFLANLNAALPAASYQLTCYARTNDTWVGATNTAPPGREPHWVGGTRFMSHVMITTDRLIVTDIARRLRGESPVSKRASVPVCD